MNTKAIIAGLIGGIIYFILGFLIFGLALGDIVMDNPIPDIYRAEDEFLWIPMILSNFIYAFFLSFVFNKWASISTFMGGLKGGLILGLFVITSVDLGIYAMSNIYSSVTSLLIDILAAVVMSLITGGVIGWWLGRK